MKKFALLVSFACTAFGAVTAQNLSEKIPANASLVIRYSGENFGKVLPIQKLDSYGFIRHDLFKMLHFNEGASLKDIGIDLQSDGYQYFVTQDTSSSFVTMLKLKDLQQFLRFMRDSAKATKFEKMNGFEFFSLDDKAYIAYNSTTALIVNTNYDSYKSFYDSPYYKDLSVDTMAVATLDTSYYDFNDRSTEILDTAVAVEKAPVQKKKPVQKSKTPAKKKTGPVAKSKAPVKKTKPAPKPPKEEVIEEIIEDEVVTTPRTYYSVEDSIESMQRELWYQQQDKIQKQVQHDVSAKIADEFFNGKITSATANPDYKKVVDPAANVNIFVNTENLWNMYYSYFFGRRMFSRPGDFGDKLVKSDSVNIANAYSSAANVYFDKDKLRVEQKTFTSDAELASNLKDLMKSKQNNTLVNYVNPGNIGYFSMSVNTEAMLKYYYKLIKKQFSSTYFFRDYADLVDIYVDLLEITIDEKGISDLITGNCLFVMHDLKPKTVTYTDYTYDDEYNKTEVKRTKTELAPDFSFVMETHNDAFMQKLAKLPLKYAEKEHYNYTAQNGYYTLLLDSSEVVRELYFLVKDGKVIVTTSKDVVDMTLGNGKGFAVDKDIKKSILDNNYSFKINSSVLLEKLRGEFNTGVNRKIADYLIDNIGDVKAESNFKNNMIQSTTTMNVKGVHSNSFEFFFNMIEAINNIIDKDRQDQIKKLD